MSDQPVAVTLRELLAGLAERDVQEMREVTRRALADDAELRFGRLAIDFHEAE